MLYLINPPQWSTGMPPVASTCLSGFAEKECIPYKQIDLSIKFYNYLFNPEFPVSMGIKNGKKVKKLDDTVFDYSDFLLKNITFAIQNLRDEKSCLSPQNWQWSFKIINDYLKLISEIISPVSLTLNSMSFGVENINSYGEVINELLLKKDKYKIIINIFRNLVLPLNIKKGDLVGFSINNFSQFISAVFLCTILKEQDGLHCFLGGSYISANAESIIKCDKLFSVFDSICLFDGEHPIKDLYEHFEYGKKLEFKNIVFKENRTLYGKEEYCIEDIKKLPPPSYRDICFTDYLSPIRIISLPISRGCYGSCTFCSYNHLASSKWREQSIDQIIDCIRYCKLRYETNYFFFSVATLSPKMARELSVKLIEEKVDIIWASGIRMESAFDENLISLMAQSGCKRLDIGAESFSQNVLNDMNKKVRAASYKRIIKSLAHYGIYPYLYIIKNFPTETVNEWMTTVNALEEVKEHLLGFSCYNFFLTQGSRIYETPELFNVQLKFDSNRKDVIEKIKWFKTELINNQMRNEKERILSGFYEKNKALFRHYGNSFIKRDFPIAFQNQLLYISGTCKLDMKKKRSLNFSDEVILDKKTIIIIEETVRGIKLQSLLTGFTVVMSLSLLALLSKKMTVAAVLSKIGESEEKNELIEKLYQEGFIRLLSIDNKKENNVFD